ncbi:hypothetical protein JI721_14865 [Alicyclobacillus cycloheptanicus]|uniref:Uncharacterized protein n=1 Tax=Alicyclobacillus cycloheptanicus TaxID=1457 RepID=A0ABT9XD45_9BACL|nr:hypothetical protein [Alicyclobacillus cycloheptanicus]MDQ0188216.1 hypothetical protein [Alicyclobacillus cycloheptanicus]WDM00946.1 hypothetical protein JI721_14865 [Alicyclobacillus cycloheptanicus]
MYPGGGWIDGAGVLWRGPWAPDGRAGWDVQPWLTEPWLTSCDPWMPAHTPWGPEGAWHVYPWWLRSGGAGWQAAPWPGPWHGFAGPAEAWAGRGAFSQSYPHGYPYFPLPSMLGWWSDAWAMQPYHSVWWG